MAEALKVFHRQRGARLRELAVRLLCRVPEEGREWFPELAITYAAPAATADGGAESGVESPGGANAGAGDPDGDGNPGAQVTLDDPSLAAVEQELRNRRKKKKLPPKRMNIGPTLMKRPYLVVPVLAEPADGKAQPQLPDGTPVPGVPEGNRAAVDAGLAADPIGSELRHLEALLGAGYAIESQGDGELEAKVAAFAAKASGPALLRRKASEDGGAVPSPKSEGADARAVPSPAKSRPRQIVTEIGEEAKRGRGLEKGASPVAKKSGVRYHEAREGASPNRLPRGGYAAADTAALPSFASPKCGQQKKGAAKGSARGAETASDTERDDRDRRKRSMSSGKRAGGKPERASADGGPRSGRRAARKGSGAPSSDDDEADRQGRGRHGKGHRHDRNSRGSRSPPASGGRKRSKKRAIAYGSGSPERHSAEGVAGQGKRRDKKMSYRSSGDEGSRADADLALAIVAPPHAKKLAQNAGASNDKQRTTGTKLAKRSASDGDDGQGRVGRLLVSWDEQRLERMMHRLTRSTCLDRDRQEAKVTYLNNFIVSVICTVFFIWTGVGGSEILICWLLAREPPASHSQPSPRIERTAFLLLHTQASQPPACSSSAASTSTNSLPRRPSTGEFAFTRRFCSPTRDENA